MSDFLGHLAARSLAAGPARAIEPRPSPLYEPPRPEGSAMAPGEEAFPAGVRDAGRAATGPPESEGRAAVSAAPTTVRRTPVGPPAPAGERAAEPAATPWRERLAGVAVPRSEQNDVAGSPGKPTASESPARSGSPTASAAAQQAALEAAAAPNGPAAPVAPHSRTVERVVVERLALPVEVLPALGTSLVAAPVPQPERREHGEVRGAERVLGEPATAHAAPPARARSAAAAVVPPAEAARPAGPRPPLPPDLLPRIEPALPLAAPPPSPSESLPTIQVTIGRIEVRATPRAAAPARPRASAPATPTLADYLGQRNGTAGR